MTDAVQDAPKTAENDNAAKTDAPPAPNKKSRLENRDYTLIIDKSGSMADNDVKGYKSRWHAVQESARAIARKLDEYDPDGITLYVFANSFKRYDNVTPDKVDQVFAENDPGSGTNLAGVLEHAFDSWKERKKAGELKDGETIVVITDGIPNDEQAVADQITRVTKSMDKDEELAVTFFQVGSDQSARSYLKRLDDQLPAEGAKFDIVDTKTFDELENTTLQQALLDAIDD